MRKILALILCCGLAMPALADDQNSSKDTKTKSGCSTKKSSCGCDCDQSGNNNSSSDPNSIADNPEDADEYGD